MEIVKLIDKGNSKNRDAYLSNGEIVSCLLNPMYKIENARQLQDLINIESNISTQDWLSMVLLYRINGKWDSGWHNVSKEVIIEPYYNFTDSEMDSLRDEYVENNLTDIRAGFEEFLINDCDYSRKNISEVWDGWSEYLEKEKKVFNMS